MATGMDKGSAERAATAKSIASLAALVAKIEPDLKKASAQADKTRKELSAESDD